MKNINIKRSSFLINKEKPLIIAGPCSAETEEQLICTAQALAKGEKTDILRAGIWKPRTRPNSFEGVGSIGLRWLQKAKQLTGLPIAVEVANAKHVYEALRHQVDVLWIGARTTSNPFSVQEIADALWGVDIPIMVKNPINPDLKLWLGAIERLERAGIKEIAAIHRGFSSFGNHQYRNIPQWQIPIELKRLRAEIPLIVDPSHIGGDTAYIAKLSQYALDLNFDGLMIETHTNPKDAWSDAQQQLTPLELEELLSQLIIKSKDSKTTKFKHQLDFLRQNINRIDDELLSLIASRMEVAEEIGQFKKDHQLSILQSDRWEELFEHRMEKGSDLGLSPEFLENYLKAIHQESIQHQR